MTLLSFGWEMKRFVRDNDIPTIRAKEKTSDGKQFFLQVFKFKNREWLQSFRVAVLAYIASARSFW